MNQKHVVIVGGRFAGMSCASRLLGHDGIHMTLIFSFPLYSLTDAEKLRSRIIAAFEDADRDPKLIERGVLNFINVGAGPMGTEIAGAISDMLQLALPKEFSDLALKKAQIYLVDYSHKGIMAYLTWLGVHAFLLTTLRQKIEALFEWSWGYFGHTQALQILGRSDSWCIQWNNKKR